MGENLIVDLDELDGAAGLNGSVSLKMNRSIVSCVGASMHHQIGIAAKIFSCLSENKINIEMISQGSSEISISVVVQAEDMDKAIHAIHEDHIYGKVKIDLIN